MKISPKVLKHLKKDKKMLHKPKYAFTQLTSFSFQSILKTLYFDSENDSVGLLDCPMVCQKSLFNINIMLTVCFMESL